ncbi:uncharacterized protein LOC117642409 isoform X2 [Thrips palmi]|uniref:Uncharacterized protein LOC117642409 isoform X2 n=1 Tax=Thrips palmi TaxID=161013 RepID=A0A6P8YHP3_THRPL|nr:uncharacterized protein LOC117642409 isoform X2 [Thrips palmi]
MKASHSVPDADVRAVAKTDLPLNLRTQQQNPWQPSNAAECNTQNPIVNQPLHLPQQPSSWRPSDAPVQWHPNFAAVGNGQNVRMQSEEAGTFHVPQMKASHSVPNADVRAVAKTGLSLNLGTRQQNPWQPSNAAVGNAQNVIMQSEEAGTFHVPQMKASHSVPNADARAVAKTDLSLNLGTRQQNPWQPSNAAECNTQNPISNQPLHLPQQPSSWRPSDAPVQCQLNDAAEGNAQNVVMNQPQCLPTQPSSSKPEIRKYNLRSQMINAKATTSRNVDVAGPSKNVYTFSSSDDDSDVGLPKRGKSSKLSLKGTKKVVKQAVTIDSSSDDDAKPTMPGNKDDQHNVEMIDESSDSDIQDFPVLKEVEDLLNRPSALDTVDGMSRQCILAYFSCFKPESKTLSDLPQLQPVEDESHFFSLLDNLPHWLRSKIKKLYQKAKASFLK